MPQRTIGLALSGGGFRASFYHLGVVRFLRDYDLLKEIEVVSSVSGGSILSPLLAENWDRLSGTVEKFDAAFEPLKRLARFDLRNKQTRLLPWQVSLPFLFKSTTANAAVSYDTCLFGSGSPSISELKCPAKGPKIYIMASDLNKPGCLFSFSNDGVRFHYENGEVRHVATTAPPLSMAIAASAAFPPFFLPLEVTKDFLGCKQDPLPHYPISLTDGGVYDNSGVVVLRKLLITDHPVDVTIVSDASRSLDFEHESRYPRSRRETFLRVVDTLQTRLANEIEVCSQANELWVRITGDMDPAVNCSPELKNDLALIRTDLDVFTSSEITALINLGYAQAEHQLRALISGPPRPDKLRPFCPEVVDLLPRRLTSSARVTVRLVGRDFATFLNFILFLGAVVAIYFAAHFVFFRKSNVPGVTAFYSESRDLQPDIAANIAASKASIAMVGTHFNISLDQRRDDLLRALERGVNVTVVVLDPNSQYFASAAANIGNEPTDLKEKCDVSLKYFRTLEKAWKLKYAAGETGTVGSLSLKYTEVPFMCRYYAFDSEAGKGELFINPYIDRLRSIESPAYRLDTGSELGKKYVQSIRATMLRSKPAPEVGEPH
jgi:predicted acylesterase/phospholipase RssA